MILYLIKWDIRPEKAEEYNEWAKNGTEMSLALPGIVEFKAFRSIMADNQVICLYEFNDMSDWAAWMADEAFQKHFEEERSVWTNMSQELYGPSALVPKPIRP